MLDMKDVIKSLQENGLRSTVKILIGGIPTSQHFCDEIGADAWGSDALEATTKARLLTGE